MTKYDSRKLTQNVREGYDILVKRLKKKKKSYNQHKLVCNQQYHLKIYKALAVRTEERYR